MLIKFGCFRQRYVFAYFATLSFDLDIISLQKNPDVRHSCTKVKAGTSTIF